MKGSLCMHTASSTRVRHMVLCALLSMLVGSWGTIGTIGLAMAGLAQIMGIPLPIAAGAIVSGSYVGDRISPLTDTSNLASAITNVNIIENVKHKIDLPLLSLGAAAVLFLVIGLGFHTAGGISGEIEELRQVLAEHFAITPFSFLPLILLVGLMIFRIPAIPSLVAGILSAVLQAMEAGGASFLWRDSLSLVSDRGMWYPFFRKGAMS